MFDLEPKYIKILNKSLCFYQICSGYELCVFDVKPIQKSSEFSAFLVPKKLCLNHKKRHLERKTTAFLLWQIKPHLYSSFCYKKTGKPVFKNQEVFMSISHHHHFFALIFSKNRCGIDVLKRDVNLSKLQKKFFFVKQKNIPQKSNKKRLLQLIWTSKEALYKTEKKQKNIHINSFKHMSTTQRSKNSFESFFRLDKNKIQTFTTYQKAFTLSFVINY